MEKFKNLISRSETSAVEQQQLENQKNVVSILAVKVLKKDTIQKSPICQIPVDILQAIIQHLKAIVPRSEDGSGAITLTELTQHKMGILSLMSTCYDIYSKTRHLFINNAEVYLNSLNGIYKSVNKGTLDYSGYSKGEIAPGYLFSYVYMTDLDTTQNKVSGVFKIQNVFKEKPRKKTPTFKITHFDVEPIFSVPLAYFLVSLTNNGPYSYFANYSDATLLDSFTINPKLFEKRQEKLENIYSPVPVSSLFQFTGLLIRFCVSEGEWKKINKHLKNSILEREKAILDRYCGPYSVAKDARKNSPFCVYSQFVSFPIDFLLPEGREKLSLNLLLNFNDYKERKGEREREGGGEFNYYFLVTNEEIHIAGIDSSPPFHLFGTELFYPKGSFSLNFENEINNLPNCSLVILRMSFLCGVGETSIIDDQDCCYGEVKKLVDKICFSSDDVLKESITRVVSKECMEPPGMSEEQLSSRILSIYNNSL